MKSIVLVICLVGICSAQKTTEWTAANFPDPHTDPVACGRYAGKPAFICDPNNLLPTKGGESVLVGLKVQGKFHSSLIHSDKTNMIEIQKQNIKSRFCYVYDFGLTDDGRLFISLYFETFIFVRQRIHLIGLWLECITTTRNVRAVRGTVKRKM